MGRRNYRRNKSTGIIGPIILLGIFLFTYAKSNPIVLYFLLFGIAAVIVIFLLFRFYRNRNKNSIQEKYSDDTTISTSANSIEQNPTQANYIGKDLMTEVEKTFYNSLTEIVDSDFIIQPQINLATIIKKESEVPFQNELYRNIDFGIFRRTNYELLLLIELNDKTHNDYKRKLRDNKVKEICNKAKIPLITFWLSMPNTKEYISNRIRPFLELNATETETMTK